MKTTVKTLMLLVSSVSLFGQGMDPAAWRARRVQGPTEARPQDAVLQQTEPVQEPQAPRQHEPQQEVQLREVPELDSLAKALEFIGRQPVAISVRHCGPESQRPDPRAEWQKFRQWAYGYPFYGYGASYSPAYQAPVYTEDHPLAVMSNSVRRELNRQLWAKKLNIVGGPTEIVFRACWTIEREEVDQKGWGFIVVSDSQRRIVTATLDAWLEYNDSGQLIFPLIGGAEYNGLEYAAKSIGPYVRERVVYEGPQPLARTMVQSMFKVRSESEVFLANAQTAAQIKQADLENYKKAKGQVKKLDEACRELAKLGRPCPQ